MADREKVLTWLEICGKNHNCSSCCPYCDGFAEYGQCLESLMADAYELLKEQEAVPVVQREVMHMFFWCCGSCGVAITDGDKFCRMCGKPVKWE